MAVENPCLTSMLHSKTWHFSSNSLTRHCAAHCSSMDYSLGKSCHGPRHLSFTPGRLIEMLNRPRLRIFSLSDAGFELHIHQWVISFVAFLWVRGNKIQRDSVCPPLFITTFAFSWQSLSFSHGFDPLLVIDVGGTLGMPLWWFALAVAVFVNAVAVGERLLVFEYPPISDIM